MKLTKIPFTIFLVIVSIVFIFAAKGYFFLIRPSYVERVVLSRSLGNPKAAIKIVEYTDFQCPACARGSLMIKRYAQAYPSKIFLQFRHFPLSMHRHALEAHLYSQCAAEQEKFWPYQDLLFEQQKQWRDLAAVDPYFKELAHQVGLNLKALDSCLNNEEGKSVIMQERMEGEEMGINSTPTYFLNGKMIIGHKNLEEELKKSLGIKDANPPSKDKGSSVTKTP